MNWDLWTFHTINGFAGTPALDHLAMFLERSHILKGGVQVTLLWYFWFRAGSGQAERRQIITCMIISTLAALAVNRAMASFLPFRIRPMYTEGIGFHPLSVEFQPDLEQWSSFPSDNATFFFALATGFFFLSRPLGLAMALYAAIVVGLPRIYFGVHYPSDILIGALVGVGVAAPFINPWTRYWVHRWIVLLSDRSPGFFYAAAFAVSYELMVQFASLRDGLRGALHLLRTHGMPVREDIAMFGIGFAGLLTVIGLMLVYRRKATLPR